MSSKTKKLISSIAAVIIFVIAGYFYLTAPNKDTTDAGDGVSYESHDNYVNQSEDYGTDEETQIVETTYEFRKQQYLDDHFEKHGSEFDYETAEEYLAGANRVINDPNSLYKTEAEDGDHIYYLESTNEFVVVSTDGYIRTYFRPSAGIDYFNRQ